MAEDALTIVILKPITQLYSWINYSFTAFFLVWEPWNNPGTSKIPQVFPEKETLGKLGTSGTQTIQPPPPPKRNSGKIEKQLFKSLIVAGLGWRASVFGEFSWDTSYRILFTKKKTPAFQLKRRNKTATLFVAKRFGTTINVRANWLATNKFSDSVFVSIKLYWCIKLTEMVVNLKI